MPSGTRIQRSCEGKFAELNPPIHPHMPSSCANQACRSPTLPHDARSGSHLDDRPAAANIFPIEEDVSLWALWLRPLKDLHLHLAKPGLVVVHVGEGLWGRRAALEGARGQVGPSCRGFADEFWRAGKSQGLRAYACVWTRREA